ncbi:MAG: cytochrome C [Salinivirgaceae bacterium]|nr:MAG: cytochrome C [Salinivirgaceae bacterium]
MKNTSSIINTTILILILGFLSLAGFSQNKNIYSYSNDNCLSCHSKHVSVDDYNTSVHKVLKCNACNVPVEDIHGKTDSLGHKKTCISTFKQTDCKACHKDQVAQHENSIHNSERLPVNCAQCHSDIHAIKSIKGNKTATAELCVKCHKNQTEFFSSVHNTALEKGNNDAATCTDCHGVHNIEKIDNYAQGREFHTKACMTCHSDTAMMSRNDVSTIAAKTYFESYHGKAVRLGNVEKVAGCSDCHSSHHILPASDSISTINKNNLVNTCMQCHPGSTENFAKFMPHADAHNKSKNPVLYWVTLFMNGLLIVTFLFFLVHSLMWAYRSFAEMKANKVKGISLKEQKNSKQKVYRRFNKRHIILHLFVVTSFLALSITGLPLKFNDTQWGKVLMDFLGGVKSAGIIHRVGAVVTFGYFFITLYLTGRFLFTRKVSDQPFLKRLFGVDSLFPNRRDMKDLRAMFRWFVFKGPKPTFDRWTYWEKFDFLAVFWGVAVIGSSGLMLWFPEFFSNFMPGWTFNVATIVHSDEALLATGFIFTIHFFNTHFRAEKFPMDFVIFNGQVTEEEMKSERPELLKRYEEEGTLDKYLVKKRSSLAWDISLRLFGFTALLTGIVLALLILFSFIG